MFYFGYQSIAQLYQVVRAQVRSNLVVQPRWRLAGRWVSGSGK
jgi:hypothetical protein